MAPRDLIALVIVGAAAVLVAVLAVRAWEGRPPDQAYVEALVGAELSAPDSWPRGRFEMVRHYLSLPIPNQMWVMPEGEVPGRSWVYHFQADLAYTLASTSRFECVTEGLASGYEWICETAARDSRGLWTYSLRSTKSSPWKEFVAILRPE